VRVEPISFEAASQHRDGPLMPHRHMLPKRHANSIERAISQETLAPLRESKNSAARVADQVLP
jgi:hypothetical protein